MEEDERDRKELANRLFATATAMLEDAVEIASTGQSGRRSLEELVLTARALGARTRKITAIAEAVMVVAEGDPRDPPPELG